MIITLQESLWPPPLDEPLLGTDDSDRDVSGNLEDVREAIHNAMDSVNRYVSNHAHVGTCKSAFINRFASPCLASPCLAAPCLATPYLCLY